MVSLKAPKPQDIIEIIESHYVASHPIGNKYVVIESYDGYDVCIINEDGKFDMVCGEDFKIISSVGEERQKFSDAIKKRDQELLGENYTPTKPEHLEEWLNSLKKGN